MARLTQPGFGHPCARWAARSLDHAHHHWRRRPRWRSCWSLSSCLYEWIDSDSKTYGLSHLVPIICEPYGSSQPQGEHGKLTGCEKWTIVSGPRVQHAMRWVVGWQVRKSDTWGWTTPGFTLETMASQAVQGSPDRAPPERSSRRLSAGLGGT